MNLVIPTIGARGYYRLAAPFDSKLSPNEMYTCQAIRRIGDYLALNEDPYNNIYLYNGLTEADFNTDQQENMYIVSLQADTGQWLYVPARYLLGYPIMNGVPYQNMMLGVGLGAVPADMNMSALQNLISDVVFDNIGVRPQISPVVLSKQKLVSRQDHEAIQTARGALASQKKSFYTRYREMVTLYNKAIAKITALETYIKANHIP